MFEKFEKPRKHQHFIGGYFPPYVADWVREQAKQRHITVTDFLVETFQKIIKEDQEAKEQPK